MRAEVWVHGAVFALAVAQFFVFWYLYRRSTMSSTHEARGSGAAVGADGNREASDHHVACPNCGAVNTARFQYCQDCVEELPRSARTS
jgi:predicted RNA-binding Zn-ribbon protein involved in translation (DUF1610 family)